jgi:hypothetical protein
MLCFQHIQPSLLSLYSTHIIAASVYQSFYLLYLPPCTLLCLFSSPASLYVAKPVCKYLLQVGVAFCNSAAIFDSFLWCSVVPVQIFKQYVNLITYLYIVLMF